MLVINRAIRIPLDEFRFDFVRSSGPGGQNVNKVNSKSVLTWKVLETESLPREVRNRFAARYARRISQDGWLIISSQRFRDRGRNIDDCLDKLRQMILEVAVPPKPRKATRPTKASQQRRLAEKQARSRRKSLRRGPVEE
jgi:ribosome-associated protein